MPLLFTEPYGNTATDAFQYAAGRGVLPTWMGTAELSEVEMRILERAVFSARTTHAVYLQALKVRIERLIAGGYKGDQAQLRWELKQILVQLGYDPVRGFPGDAALGIPSARPGSLQDLSSDRRIDLILDTQLELITGRGQQQRGLSEMSIELFPAWELVVGRKARVPRDWPTRFKIAGGRVMKDKTGRVRLVAHKLDEVWSVLGDRSMFRDALGTSHTPYAFGSGRVWRGVPADEWQELLKLNGQASAKPARRTPPTPASLIQLPPAQISTHGLSVDTIKQIGRELDNIEAREGVLTLRSVLGTAAAPPPPPSRARRFNALMDELQCRALLVEAFKS